MTREDLLRLIARAVRRSFTFASESQALGAADTVLRDLKAVGIRILGPRTRPAKPPGSPERVDQSGDLLKQHDEQDRAGHSGRRHHGPGSHPPE
ncbi:MAG TPA: hypothetical protein VF031_05090 [Alphaproteobacteria bacterium]